MNWQKIETAPRDGIPVLGYFPNLEPGYHDTVWLEQHQIWASRDYPTQPTHWMPLPEPPHD